MNTVQITIFLIFGLGWIIGYFKVSFRLDLNRKDSVLWQMIYTFCGAAFILFTILSTLELNKTRDINKCPELEKVENVYRIK